MSASVYKIDPLQDLRWPAFLERHPQASVFHTQGWLKALWRTYGYEPFVLSTSPPGEELKNAIVFCRVKSWLTGHRIVSVPFADHCQPLVESPESLQVLLEALREEQGRAKWKYVELRPLASDGKGGAETPHPSRPIGTPSPQGRGQEPELGSQPSPEGRGGTAERWMRGSASSLNGNAEGLEPFGKCAEFYFHSLDLRPDLNSLYRNLHKSCVQRKIQRAEREHLVYEQGRSEAILAKFYHLLLLTRRRHQLPPQPLAWFRNLVECLGDGARIHIVSKDGQPIASIFMLFFKKTLVYKYGCSDGRFHNLGGMPLLFWKAIQQGKQLGAQEFDLGRSETDNPGLIEFKRHLGAACSALTYYAYPPRISTNSASGWKMRIARNAFGWLPEWLLAAAGKLLYKHVG